MNAQIIVAGLKARPVRSCVSVLAVALEVLLILSIVGLVAGMIKGSAQQISESGADIILTAPGQSFIFGISNAVLPEVMGTKLATLDHVAAVSPIIVQSNLGRGGDSGNVWGIDPPSYDRVTGGFRFLEGGLFAADNEVVVDDKFAKKQGVHVGDDVALLDGKYRVAGIVANGKGARVFMPLKALQKIKDAIGYDRQGNPVGKVTFFFIKLDQPDLFETFRDGNEALKTYSVINVHEFAYIFENGLPGLDEFRGVVVFISMCIGVMVIFLSTYTAVTERTREIGILRSLGATQGLIVKLVIRESIFICAAGAAIGTGASFVTARLVEILFPTQTLEITGNWIAFAILMAILSGVLGSMYPAFKAAKLDPIEALAYE